MVEIVDTETPMDEETPIVGEQHQETNSNGEMEMVHDHGMMDHGHEDIDPNHNPHSNGSGKHGEHMAAMDLFPENVATHIAVKDGSWFSARTWQNNKIPGGNAKVLIPQGRHILYDQQSNTRLHSVRVDGLLHFSSQKKIKNGCRYSPHQYVRDSVGWLDIKPS